MELVTVRGNDDGDVVKPVAVTGHRIVGDIGGLYLVGGWTPVFNDGTNSHDPHVTRTVWKFNYFTRRWTLLRDAPSIGDDLYPIELASHGLFLIDRGQTLLVFGGSLSPLAHPGSSDKLLLFTLGDCTWHRQPHIGTPPPVDIGHWFGHMGYFDSRTCNLYVATGLCDDFMDAANGSMLIFRLTITLNEYHWTELKPSAESPEPPTSRCRHEVICYNDKLYIFGGSQGFSGWHHGFETVPCFNLTTNCWSVIETLADGINGRPPNNRLCAVTFDQRRGRLFVCGGRGVEHTTANEIWQLDLEISRWRQVCVCDDPQLLWFHAAVYSAQLQQVFTFGGCREMNYHGPRSNDVFSVYVGENNQHGRTPRSLLNSAWRTLSLHFAESLERLTKKQLRSLGFNQIQTDMILF